MKNETETDLDFMTGGLR